MLSLNEFQTNICATFNLYLQRNFQFLPKTVKDKKPYLTLESILYAQTC